MRRLLLLSAILTAAAAAVAVSQDKPIITVLDLTVDQVSESEMKTLISLLSSELFQTGRYTVIDVSERDRILEEIEFSASECTDEGCQIEIGKLLAAEFIVVGRLGKIGTRTVLSLKALETSTSRTVGTADGVYDKLEDMLGDLKAIAAKLSGAAPAPAARARMSGRTVAAVAFTAGGLTCATVGAFLLVSGLRDFYGPVAEAYDAYLGEPLGSTAHADRYQQYLDEFAAARGKIVPGLGLAAGAVALGATAVVLFAQPAVRAERAPVAQLSLVTRGTALEVAVRLRW